MLTDNGTVSFACVNCKAELFVYWQTKKTPGQWSLRGENCPWCDASPKTKGLGGTRTIAVSSSGKIGGAVHRPDAGPDQEGPSTIVEGDYLPDENDVIIIHVAKASPDALPVLR